MFVRNLIKTNKKFDKNQKKTTLHHRFWPLLINRFMASKKKETRYINIEGWVVWYKIQLEWVATLQGCYWSLCLTRSSPKGSTQLLLACLEILRSTKTFPITLPTSWTFCTMSDYQNCFISLNYPINFFTFYGQSY